MTNFDHEDRYHLRKAQMDADKKALEAQKAQQELERLVLELEHKYGLIADGKTLDPRTAAILEISPAHRNNGRESAEALVAVGPDEGSK